MNFNGMKQGPAQMIAVLSLAWMLGAPACYAADGPVQSGAELVTREQTMPQQTAASKWAFGGEIDALPFVMSGYYGSGFVGRGGWKFRAVAARSTLPSFMVTDGFKDKRSDAYAVLADRFIGARRQKLEGLWVGGGGEYWRNRIRTDAAPTYANYHNYMLTVGSGYVWKLSRHVYLNPWTAGHFAVAGERNILVSGKTYKQPVFTPEGSIKLGFTF
jgi:hypothetical protein